MGHYTGPKAKINRRLGVNVYDSGGAIRAARKRPTPPGEHPWRNRKPSAYGLALMNKQVLKHYYGLSERQLWRFFQVARRQRGNVGSSLLEVCERRLDNLVRRAGLARTRSQARQGVAHGHFTVNGKIARTASQLLKAGDVVAVRGRANLREFYKNLAEDSAKDRDSCAVLDQGALTFAVQALPKASEVTLDVNIDKVVVLLSR